MRPIAVLAALLLVVLAAAWWWSRDAAPPPPAPAIPAASSPAPDAAAADAARERPDTAEPRTVADDPSKPAAAAPPAGPAPDELWGRVVVAGSQAPVPGADVVLEHRDADEFWNLDLRYGERRERIGRTQSGADGRFRFAVARARQHVLRVAATGFATATRTSLTGGSEVTVELAPGATVEGVVRCGGAPLAGVPVRIAVAGESVELAKGDTTAGGAFWFTGLQPCTAYVQVQSHDHSESWRRLVLEPGGTHRVEIDLEPGKELRGRVVDAATSLPVADAELSDSWTFKRIARTGADGRFVLRGIEDDGSVCVQVRARGYATAFRSVAGKLDEDCELRLVRGGEVAGRLVTAAGAPPAGAYAAVAANYMESAGMQGCDWIRAEIAGDGRFVAAGLRPELHYWLYVRARGCGTRVYALPRPLPNGERQDVGDVVLRPAGGVEGRATDDAGQPVAGVEVALRGTNADRGAWLPAGATPEGVSQFESRDTKTDPGGVFRFADVAAGEYVVSMRPQGHSETITRTVQVEDGALVEGVTLVVPVGLTIEGVLARADGTRPGDGAGRMQLTAALDGGRSVSVSPDPDGRFRFAGLAAGDYTITLWCDAPGWCMAPRTNVPAGTGDLRLALEAASSVTGRVVDADGKAVKARVWARPAGSRGGSPLTTTADDGTFRVEVPASFVGSVGAAAIDDWMQQANVEDVRAGQSDLVLQLRQR